MLKKIVVSVMSSNMLSLGQLMSELKKVSDDGNNRKCDLVYIFDRDSDVYFTVHNVRIDSENDIVIDVNIHS